LLHSWKGGEARVPAFLDDYAALGLAFLDLYEATTGAEHLEWAERLAARMLGLFWDDTNGGFFYTPADHERLILRTKPVHDGSMPSGNSLATMLCLRLHAFTEEERYSRVAERVLRLYRGSMEENPSRTPTYSRRSIYTRGNRERSSWWHGVAARRRRSARAPRADLPSKPSGRLLRPGLAAFSSCRRSRDKPLVDSRPTAYVCHARPARRP
jgi:uncharacterized protein YyaL (SSP411 family)